MAKWVYMFTEGNANMRNLLGGKGANLAEMTNLGLPVPQGFTITTEACTQYYEDGRQINDEIMAQIMEAITKMEGVTGKKFGDKENPLLVSVRSGARASMPGMMDTILNLGLNEDVVNVLAEKSGNARWAWDCYRRFIQMYSDVVMEVGKKYFEELIDEMKAKRGVKQDVELTAEDLHELAEQFKAEYKAKIGADFPTDPKEQLMGAIKAVFRSWDNPRANVYRRDNDTSPAGVEIFFDEMDRKEMDVRSLGQAKIAVIGEGTKKKLKEHHLLADFVPGVYDGDTLGAELAKQLQGNEKILIPRAEAGNKKLTELLEQTGAKVDDIATYTTCYEKSRLIDEKKELETGSVDCVVFTSASTVKGFVEGTKGLDYTKVKAACIGKQTKAAADAYGMQTRMAKKATIESLIELVEEMKQEN